MISLLGSRPHNPSPLPAVGPLTTCLARLCLISTFHSTQTLTFPRPGPRMQSLDLEWASRTYRQIMSPPTYTSRVDPAGRHRQTPFKLSIPLRRRSPVCSPVVLRGLMRERRSGHCWRRFVRDTSSHAADNRRPVHPPRLGCDLPFAGPRSHRCRLSLRHKSASSEPSLSTSCRRFMCDRSLVCRPGSTLTPRSGTAATKLWRRGGRVAAQEEDLGSYPRSIPQSQRRRRENHPGGDTHGS
jgi:hypothetical protein